MKLHYLLVVIGCDVSDVKVASSTITKWKYGVWCTQLLHQ